MSFKKAFILLLIISFLLIPLLSCAKKSADKKIFKVVMVTDAAGLGDKGFNDAGWAGVQKAMKELHISGICLQSYEQADYIPNLSLAAQQADIVLAMGFLMVDAMKKVAPQYPDKKFIFIDGKIEAPNVASYDFKGQEGSFLAGIIAAIITKTGKVGIVEGMEIPPVKVLEYGFRAGVLTVNKIENKNVAVLVVAAGDFNNPSKGKSLANVLISKKTDVIYQLAGNTGLGVLEAVKEARESIFAIGVDIDQDDLVPGKVLTSVLKGIDIAVYNSIKKAYQGDFKAGHYWIGLAEGASRLTSMKYTRDIIPAKALELVESAKNAIINGKLKVPRNQAELDSFLPPQL
jgi:basic membrane protein A